MLGLLAAFLIAVPTDDAARPRPISQLVHSRWTAKEGAPNEIRALAQTGDGYLWLGTAAGLFRFDGVRFVRFVPRSGDTLPGTGVSRLMTTRDGTLWIVWPNGAVSHVRDGRVTSWSARDGLPATFQLAESHHGELLAGTATGLARFVDGRWQDLGAAWELPGREVRGVWFDRADVLWVQTDASIVYLPSGALRFVNTGMIVRDRASPADFAQAQDGAVWINELARSAHTLRVLGDTVYPTEVRVRATTVLVDRRGSLWIGTAGDGLRRVLDPPRFRGKVITRFGTDAEQFTSKEGLLADIVNALCEDREGNVWVASNAGLERFRHGAFTPITPIGPPRARFLFASRDTSVWSAAQEVTGVVRLSTHDTATVPTNFVVTNLAQNAAGALFTVRNHRILKFQGRGFAPLPLRKVVAINLVGLTFDVRGQLWLYDEDAGLLKLDGDSLVRVAPLYEPVARRGVLLGDRSGRVWIGQLNRVALYDRGKLTLFDTAQGVPIGMVTQIIEDLAGNIWAVGEGGISKFVNGRFRTLPERRSVPGRSVYGVALDYSGAWWMVTRSGVLRVPVGEFDRALNDSTYRPRYRTFDQHEGLPGAVTVSEWGLPIASAADGRIWVATDSGVANVDPHNLPRELPSPALIEAVHIGGRSIAPSDVTPIPAGQRDLEIDYTATNLANPEQTQFRYRLDGEDQSWHDVGTQRRVTYSGLGPGTYRFRVATKNSEGVWDERGSVWSFRVLPPWYQTRSFGAAFVVLVAAIGASASAIVQRRRHARAQEALRGQYEATLAERGRIAQDLHDTLLQGFIGVTLQLKAAERELPANPEVAGETLRQVQRLARESLREARERVWDMRQSADANSDLPAALEALAIERASGTGIHVSTTVVGERRALSPSVEDAVFRIGREAIANAIQHAEAHRIEIVVTFRERSVRLDVRDDGKGFAPEKAEEARQHGHFGLSGARERAMRMGGQCEIHAPVDGGTVVALELPC